MWRSHVPLEHAQGRVEAVQVYEGLPNLGLVVLHCAGKLGALLNQPGNDVSSAIAKLDPDQRRPAQTIGLLHRLGAH